MAINFFAWPLKPAASLNYNSYYGISNYVDQNLNTGLLEYNCSAHSHDDHRGTDYFTWPFALHLVENDLVEVIASAWGAIISKSNGQCDDHFSCYGTWNVLYVQHADGSIAQYGHLKENSTNSKNVGETVIEGEYLGIIASSGFSTGPYLHFEIYETTSYTTDNLIDLYSGLCNSYNPTSLWENQLPFSDPTENAVLTHEVDPIYSYPGINEDPNISDTFFTCDLTYTASKLDDNSRMSSRGTFNKILSYVGVWPKSNLDAHR